MVENIGDVCAWFGVRGLITPRLVLILTACRTPVRSPRFAPVPVLL